MNILKFLHPILKWSLVLLQANTYTLQTIFTRMNPTEGTSPPPTTPIPSDTRKVFSTLLPRLTIGQVSSSMTIFMLINLPIPDPISETSPPSFVKATPNPLWYLCYQ